jgi:hypothetical protein
MKRQAGDERVIMQEQGSARSSGGNNERWGRTGETNKQKNKKEKSF